MIQCARHIQHITKAAKGRIWTRARYAHRHRIHPSTSHLHVPRGERGERRAVAVAPHVYTHAHTLSPAPAHTHITHTHTHTCTCTHTHKHIHVHKKHTGAKKNGILFCTCTHTHAKATQHCPRISSIGNERSFKARRSTVRTRVDAKSFLFLFLFFLLSFSVFFFLSSLLSLLSISSSFLLFLNLY